MRVLRIQGGQSPSPRVLGFGAVCLGALLFNLSPHRGAVDQQASLSTLDPRCNISAVPSGGAGQQAGSDGPAPLPPGTMPMEHPSKASFDKLQADPGLAERDASIVEEFAAAPWLLPTRTKALNYAGVHQLDELVKMRATPQGSYNKTVSLLTLDMRVSTNTQNAVYSMVKYGGARNYIVGTWDPEALKACADLNLPCADITSFLAEPLDNGPSAGEYKTHDYNVICWVRPAVVAYLLQQGYAVLNSDSDIVYSLKPVWSSYLKLIERAQADAAFQKEEPVNGGNYVMLPTPAAVNFATQWAGFAKGAIQLGSHDQEYAKQYENNPDAPFYVCSDTATCAAARQKISQDNKTDTHPLLRTYDTQFLHYHNDGCGLAQGSNMPTVDMCDPAIFYLHPICTNQAGKLPLFKGQGVWFLDDESCKPRPGALTQVAACQLARWRDPKLEAHLSNCAEYRLALDFERAAPLQAPALQAGAASQR